MNGEYNKREIFVCTGDHCKEDGSKSIETEFLLKLNQSNLTDIIKIREIECQKLCKFGPIIVIEPDQTLYTKVKKEDIEDIINVHFKKNNIVERLLFKDKIGTVYQTLEQIKAARKAKKESKKVKDKSIQKDENSRKKKEVLKEVRKREVKMLKEQSKEKLKNDYREKKDRLKLEYKEKKKEIKEKKKNSK